MCMCLPDALCDMLCKGSSLGPYRMFNARLAIWFYSNQ